MVLLAQLAASVAFIWLVCRGIAERAAGFDHTVVTFAAVTAHGYLAISIIGAAVLLRDPELFPNSDATELTALIVLMVGVGMLFGLAFVWLCVGNARADYLKAAKQLTR